MTDREWINILRNSHYRAGHLTAKLRFIRDDLAQIAGRPTKADLKKTVFCKSSG